MISHRIFVCNIYFSISQSSDVKKFKFIKEYCDKPARRMSIKEVRLSLNIYKVLTALGRLTLL